MNYLIEIRFQIGKDKFWYNRARNIELFHSHLILTRKKWSLRKTAKALRLCASTVCEDLALAAYLIDDPSIERFKTRKEALRFIKGRK